MKRTLMSRAYCASLLLIFVAIPVEATEARGSTRDAFLKIIDRPSVDPAPQEQPLPSTGADEAFTHLHFTYASDAANRVPGLLYKRKDAQGRAPAVIILHGTGGKKDNEVSLLRRMAEKGFVAVAIDGRYHGERAPRGAKVDYDEAIARAFETGGEHPFYYDTVWDVMRLIDVLSARSDVDPKRIGLMGFSKGGIETYLASAVDERIAVSIPCIGVQSFNYALEHDLWKPRIDTIKGGAEAAAHSAGVKELDTAFVRRFYDRVVPGIYGDFDGPKMVTLIAPRPLLVINGDSDSKTPMEGLQLCASAARDAYTKAGVTDRFILRVQKNTGHKVNEDSTAIAIDWFAKWLKPATP